MTHYRDLNKELIGQVQKMRLDIRSCLNEIVRLKEELMEKHETEVNLRKQCYSWAVNSFVQLMQSVQPDSDIIPILKEYVQPEEVYATSSPDGRVRSSKTMGRRSSEARRSSTSILAKDMQRSNSVINIRKSIRRTSPIRRNSKEHSHEDEEEQSSQFVQHAAEVSQKLINSSFRNTIYEYSVEEEEEVFDVESVCESIEEPDSSQAISTLKDITNTLAAIRNSSQEENILSKTDLKRTRDKKTKLRNVCHQKNTKHFIDNEEESFQELRRYSKEQTLVTNRSIPINQDNEDVNSPTLVYTDITLRNFKNAAACSTPNSLYNSLLNARSPSKKDEFIPDLTSTASVLVASTNISTRPTRRIKPTNLAEPKMDIKREDEYTTDFTSIASMESTNTSARPTRRCKPTNLAEPKVKSKLRNESESGYKLKKKKPRSKSKTKI